MSQSLSELVRLEYDNNRINECWIALKKLYVEIKDEIKKSGKADISPDVDVQDFPDIMKQFDLSFIFSPKTGFEWLVRAFVRDYVFDKSNSVDIECCLKDESISCVGKSMALLLRIFQMDDDNNEECLAVANESIKVFGEFYMSHLNRALYLRKLKRYNEAVKAYHKVQKIRPEEDRAYTECAGVFQDLGQPNNALEECNKGIKFNSKIFIDRGNIYRELKENGKAIEDYTKFIESSESDETGSMDRNNSDLISAYRQRASIFYELDEYAKGILDYTKVIELDPNVCDAMLFNRGYCYYRCNDERKALLDFERYIEHQPKVPDGYWMSVKCHEHINEYQEAIKFCDQLISLFPKEGKYYLYRSKCYELLYASSKQKSHIEEALEDSKRAGRLELHNQTSYLKIYRLLLLHFGDPEKENELNYLDQLIEMHEEGVQVGESESHYDSRVTWEHYKNRACIRASEIDSKFPAFLESNIQSVVKDMERAVKLEPNNPEIYFFKGKIWIDGGNAKEGRKKYYECFRYGGVSEYKKAIESFDESIRLINMKTNNNNDDDDDDDDNTKLKSYSFIQRGKCNLILGNSIEAAEDISKALRNAQNTKEKEFGEEVDKICKSVIGEEKQTEIHRGVKNIDAMFDFYSRLIEFFEPTSREARDWYFLRGNFLREYENHEMAIKDYDEAVKIQIICSSSLNLDVQRNLFYWRGRMKLKLDLFEEAMRDFDEEEKHFPESDKPFIGRGDCLMKQEKYNEAILEFTKGVEKFEKDPKKNLLVVSGLRLHRGECYMKMGMEYREKCLKDGTFGLLKYQKKEFGTEQHEEFEQKQIFGYYMLNAQHFHEHKCRYLVDEMFSGAMAFTSIKDGTRIALFKKCFDFHKEYDPERALDDYCRLVTLENMERARFDGKRSKLDNRERPFDWGNEDSDSVIQELFEKTKIAVNTSERIVSVSSPFQVDPTTALPRGELRDAEELEISSEISEISKRAGQTNFEEYRILRTIGKGAFGAAYLCQIPSVRGLFVVKVFLSAVRTVNVKEEEVEQLSWDSVRAKEDLRIPYHRNIVTCLYSSESPMLIDTTKLPDYKKFWRRKVRSRNSKLKRKGIRVKHPNHIHSGVVIMKYHRKDLLEYCEERVLNDSYFEFKEVSFIMRYLLDGVKHLYDNKIVHRDLHLGNIFVDEYFGRILIGDFGCALDLRNNSTGFLVHPNHEILFTREQSGGGGQSSKEEGGGGGKTSIRLGGYPMHLAPEIIDFDLSKTKGQSEEEGVDVVKGELDPSKHYLNYEKSDVFSIGVIGYKLITLKIGRNDTGVFGSVQTPLYGKKKKLGNRSMEDLKFDDAKCEPEITEFVKELLHVDYSKRLGIEEALKRCANVMRLMFVRPEKYLKRKFKNINLMNGGL